MGTVVVWFRDDLRLADNPALAAAVRTGKRVVCLFVLDEASPGHRPLGAASRWWLHHSLAELTAALRRHGAALVLRRAAAAQALARLVREADAEAVFWNRRYAPAETATDTAIKRDLRQSGVEVTSFGANLLHEPWDILAKGGEPYKVFTPFWRAVRARGEPREALPAPEMLPSISALPSDRLDTWGLLPTGPDWSGGLAEAWTPGEAGARAALLRFLDGAAAGYADRRDRPDKAGTSRLSPHLRFGEVSPVQIWHAVRHAESTGALPGRDAEKILAEVGWRDFSYSLLHSAEDLAGINIQRRFDAFPWRSDAGAFRAWTKGETGYPLVDAGMRQLYQTGWMHNRVRMVAASFLVKHLLIDWRRGEEWFWDTLVDADPANNPASWQWVAGTGADAAPYFRIFNPVIQGETFDPHGAYVRRFVPELARLPDAFVQKPWQAPDSTLAQAGIRLGRDYPRPIVDHAAARRRALAALKQMAQPAGVSDGENAAGLL